MPERGRSSPWQVATQKEVALGLGCTLPTLGIWQGRGEELRGSYREHSSAVHLPRVLLPLGEL